MKTTVKAVVASIIIFLVGFGLGFLATYYWNSENPSPDSNINIEEVIKPEIERIDSLSNELDRRESIINRLRDSLKNVKVIRIYEVDSIRKLPTTEGVEFLRNKLREFESKYQGE